MNPELNPATNDPQNPATDPQHPWTVPFPRTSPDPYPIYPDPMYPAVGAGQGEYAASGQAAGPRPPDRTGRRHRVVIVGLAGICAVGLVAGGAFLGYRLAGYGTTGSPIQASQNQLGSGGSTGGSAGGGTGAGSGNGYGSGGYHYGSGGYGSGGYGSGGYGSGSTNGGGSTGASTASGAQQVGVVDIDTVLRYQGAEAAGTGMIVTNNGEVLTNNHVISGATSVSVTVVATGQSYKAKVVGTDPTQDVAVLQLSNASGLQTAKFSASSSLAVGQSVTAVGNAGGNGGAPSAVTGTITALNQPITATDGDGSHPEKLTGLIQTNAQIVPGDSGGPLYDSSGSVIGMNTAARTAQSGSTIAGFAITIDAAKSIANQIEAGQSSATIHLGYPAFLGISVVAPTGPVGGNPTQTVAGALVSQTIAGEPAAAVGIVAGDTITKIDASAITSADSLQQTMLSYAPGQHASVTWINAAGQSQHATVTLAQGPAN